jgi:hypothetical protein
VIKKNNDQLAPNFIVEQTENANMQPWIKIKVLDLEGLNAAAEWLILSDSGLPNECQVELNGENFWFSKKEEPFIFGEGLKAACIVFEGLNKKQQVKS